VLVNGKPAKAQARLEAGDKINVPLEGETYSLKPADVTARPVDIIWQGLGLLAVNKPSGLEVHGTNSLDTMVRLFLANKLPHSLSFTSGPLHRLDKPSSGIVVFSASIEGARLFSSLLHEQKVRKTYLAIVEGNVEKEQIWEDELLRDKERKKTFVTQGKSKKSKTACSFVKPLLQSGSYSLVSVNIMTGRTHQIRSQAAHHGHPLSGDKKYGGKKGSVFFLHAWKLEFLDVSVEAPPPVEFCEKINELFGEKLLRHFS
jgi:23S rRNA pseudouridine955/2504/2580 synthase